MEICSLRCSILKHRTLFDFRWVDLLLVNCWNTKFKPGSYFAGGIFFHWETLFTNSTWTHLKSAFYAFFNTSNSKSLKSRVYFGMKFYSTLLSIKYWSSWCFFCIKSKLPSSQPPMHPCIRERRIKKWGTCQELLMTDFANGEFNINLLSKRMIKNYLCKKKKSMAKLLHYFITWMICKFGFLSCIINCDSVDLLLSLSIFQRNKQYE